MAPGVRSRSRSSAQSETSLQDSGASASSSSVNRRKRAVNAKLVKALGDGMAKPRIVFVPGKARPVGPWSTEFIREVGIVCRKHAPLSCHRWKDIKKTYGSIFYGAILEKFEVDFGDPSVVKSVDKYMGQRLKEYRSRLHAYYKNLGDNVDKKQKPPSWITQNAWAEICVWFESEKFQKLSKTNIVSRQQLPVNHRGGSKAFVIYQEEQRDAESQQELGRIELYHITHWSTSKGWINALAQDNYDKMLTLRAQPPEEGSSAMTEDEICDKVLGKRSNYIRGLGNGHIPSSSSTSYAYNQHDVEEYRRRAKTAERRNEELTVQVQEQGNRLHEQGNQLQDLFAWKDQMMAMFAGRSMMSQVSSASP